MDETQHEAVRFASPHEVERLVARLRDCTLPYETWTHAAHLAVGVWHLLHYRPEEATSRIRSGIRRYNVVCGIDNTDSSGYHETLTMFYVRIIQHYLQSQDKAPLHDLVNELVESRYGSRKAPFEFYSRERLFSVEARRHWREPDLKSLPTLSA